ncbi:methionyl-tRNA formyltransferase [Nocardiopsis sp. MG754419]|uniref:methionyl-tRNA formyltransferase n=1 Tax=Nocardiopsis sp. MG754419 TaxID=2259865 RepID=UPI001BACB9DC|nr:formyltransferase family protein [Nocardiopsis sp. MG754419]MBR8742142.1 formyl transferase [Nocardiopsis sp. MG754419]
MPERRRFCYVSGLRLGMPALEELCAQGRPPDLVVSYPAELAHRCGYVDYETITRSHDLPHVRAADINGDEVRDALAAHHIDLMVVAGWSQLVHEDVLAALPLGGVGLHPSPLPVGRGRAPIPWTILRDMRASAVTLFHLAREADTGDIVDRIRFDVPADATATGLYERVGRLQAELLMRNLDPLLEDRAPRRPQSGHVSVWPRRRPSDGHLDLTAAGRDVDRMVRALSSPYPGAFAMFGGARITFRSGALSTEAVGGQAGQIVSAGPGRVWGVTCGDGVVFVPEAVSVDEGVAADPTSLAMFRPGRYFDAPSEHMLAATRRTPVPGNGDAEHRRPAARLRGGAEL